MIKGLTRDDDTPLSKTLSVGAYVIGLPLGILGTGRLWETAQALVEGSNFHGAMAQLVKRPLPAGPVLLVPLGALLILVCWQLATFGRRSAAVVVIAAVAAALVFGQLTLNSYSTWLFINEPAAQWLSLSWRLCIFLCAISANSFIFAKVSAALLGRTPGYWFLWRLSAFAWADSALVLLSAQAAFVYSIRGSEGFAM